MCVMAKKLGYNPYYELTTTYMLCHAVLCLQLPEGAAKNFTFAWVCDAKGGLYLSVNKEHMITCGTGTIDLSQTLKIQGAKPVSDTHVSLPNTCWGLGAAVVLPESYINV